MFRTFWQVNAEMAGLSMGTAATILAKKMKELLGQKHWYTTLIFFDLYDLNNK